MNWENKRLGMLFHSAFSIQRSAFKKMGFTLIEMLMVVAVVATLTAVSFSELSAFRDSSLLSKTADETVGTLKRARSRTLSSAGANSYGVYFGTSTIVLFPGTLYLAGSSANETVDISPRVEVSANTLVASQTAFRRLTGEATSAGSITFRLKQNIAKTKTIIIYESGLFKIQ